VVSVQTEARQRSGFTLVELLVVLAILVLLFGLLFAPMMTSLDMAREGQVRARMQDTVRQTMEDVQRTVSNAVHVLPLREVRPAAAPALSYVDTSQLAVIVPNAGSLTGPLQPPVRPDPSAGTQWMRAVRYVVHPRSGRIVRNDDVGVNFATYPPGTTAPLSASQPSSGVSYIPEVDDPFVLYRQVGILREVPRAQAEYGFGDRWYRFGSLVEQPTGSGTYVFYSNRPETENALSQASGCDVPCTGSVCDSCGVRYPGFREYSANCPACSAAVGYTYLFDGVRFAPQHAANEQLQPLRDGTVYRAEHGGWTGYAHSDVTVAAPQLFPRLLDPRITVYRYNSTTGGYTDLQYDSFSPGLRGTPQLDVRWDADNGSVEFGRFFLQTITLTDTGGAVNVATATDQAAMLPLESEPGVPPGRTLVPNGYQVTPAPTAIILPDTVQVRAIVTFTDGTQRQVDYVRTSQTEQSQIGAQQFAVKRALPPSAWESWVPENWALSMDVLFSEFPGTGPPGPAKFAQDAGRPVTDVRDVQLYIGYSARRNADIHSGASATARDDLVRVDYSTRNVMDVSFTLAEFVDYTEDANGNYVLPAPPPKPQQAALHDTIAVRNAGR